MYAQPQKPFVGQISRPKLNGVGRHVGVVLPNGMVAHMTQAGPVMESLTAFAQGRPVRQDKHCSPEAWQQLLFRAFQSLHGTPPYDVLSRNCEHYATWLLGEKPESTQVNVAVLVSLVGLLVGLAK